MFEEQTEKYLYRRQYVLAPRIPDGFGHWRHTQVSSDRILTTHPDLPVTVTHHQNRSLYLLGYLIDPHNPCFDDAQIMQDVIEKSKTADDVFLHTADKCGRFVVIVKIGDDFRIFSDACGLRQVFYHAGEQGSVWCSSQPHIVAEQLGIGIDRAAQDDLNRAALFRSHWSTDHWYPGNLTLFDGVFHLTPNHYLDLRSGRTVRYWPRERLSPSTSSECAPRALDLLSGIIEGAAQRFNLAFAISSGLDSRTLLAASRKVAGKIHYFTQTSKGAGDGNPDVQIPTALLKQLGLKHSILKVPEKLDDDFRAIFERNVFTARAAKGRNALSIHEHFKTEPREVVVVYGNCSEITKRDRYRFPKTPRTLLGGTALAAMARMSHSSLAKKKFAEWLTTAKKLTRYNIDVLDLMHWEQRVGNWGAMALSEYEMVYESICPCSCRKYIEHMWRVPFKYRTKPDYSLHHEIIDRGWPDVLKQEINPESSRIKKTVLDWLYRTSVYDPIKFLYIMAYRRFR